MLIRITMCYTKPFRPTKYCKILQSSTPRCKIIVFRTTMCYKRLILPTKNRQSTSPYYSVRQSTSPFYKQLLRTTRTSPWSKVLLRYKVLVRNNTYYTILLCTTKYYSIQLTHYKLLLRTTKYCKIYKKYYKVFVCTTKYLAVLLRKTKYYANATLTHAHTERSAK